MSGPRPVMSFNHLVFDPEACGTPTDWNHAANTKAVWSMLAHAVQMYNTLMLPKVTSIVIVVCCRFRVEINTILDFATHIVKEL